MTVKGKLHGAIHFDTNTARGKTPTCFTATTWSARRTPTADPWGELRQDDEALAVRLALR
jgi:hypothetical protein